MRRIMVLNKFREEMPEDEQEIKERLFELKHEYMLLVQQGAPVSEVDAVRDRAAGLESWRKHLESLRKED